MGLQLERKYLWLLGAITITAFLFWLGPQYEGFQGHRASRADGTLFPVAPFVPRKDSSRGASYKGVPLVIYHSWGSATVPPRMHKHIQELIEQNPEFDYSFNTDDDCRRFIAEHFDAEVARAFDCLRPGAYNSDLWRYCILYRKGGVYIDIKCSPKMPLIQFIDRYEPPLFVRDSPKGMSYPCVWNGFMISAAGNPIFKACIDEIVKNVKEKSYAEGGLSITGPCLLGKVMRRMAPNQISGLQDAYYKIVDESGKVVMDHYPSYRDDQRRFQKTEHYTHLYRRGQVYAC